MLIRLLNFARYNPRGDVKNPSWVRLERMWWVDMYGWSADAQRIWFMLLGLAKFETGVADVEPGFISANLQLKVADVLAALDFLTDKKRIEIVACADVTPASRGRYVDGTSAGVTDGTNGTGEDVVGDMGDLNFSSWHKDARARVDPQADARRILARALGAPGRVAPSEAEEDIWAEAGELARAVITVRYKTFRLFWDSYTAARRKASQTMVDGQFREEFAAILTDPEFQGAVFGHAIIEQVSNEVGNGT